MKNLFFVLLLGLIVQAPTLADEESPVKQPGASQPSLTEEIRIILESGALDDALEKRWDLIQQRKRALRLSQLREKKAKAAKERNAAIKKYIPAPDVAHEPYLGKKDAAISLIVYSDFGCPYCKKFHHTAKAFIDKYGQHVNLLYRSMPLSIHEPYATELAVGGRCIYQLSGNQAYWNFTDAAFSDPSAKTGKTFVGDFTKSLGFSNADLTACMTSRDALSVVEKQIKEAGKALFTGTPSVLLRNNLSGESRFFAGSVSLGVLEGAMREMAEKADDIMSAFAKPATSYAPGNTHN